MYMDKRKKNQNNHSVCAVTACESKNIPNTHDVNPQPESYQYWQHAVFMSFVNKHLMKTIVARLFPDSNRNK